MLATKSTVDLITKEHISKITLRKTYPTCRLSIGEEVDLKESLKESSDGIYITTHAGAVYLDKDTLKYYNIFLKEGTLERFNHVLERFNHVLGIPLFQVRNTIQNPNKYTGEWHKVKKNAIAEAKSLNTLAINF